MQRTIHKHQVFSLIAVLMLSLFLFETTPGRHSESIANNALITSSYIVQASSAADARNVVIKVGGRVTATLNIINAVGADLSEDQVEWLRTQPERIKVFRDSTLNVSGSVAETHYPTLIGAAELHEQGINGKGITIAVLDTGLWKSEATECSADGKMRILAQYDATVRRRRGDDDHDDWSPVPQSDRCSRRRDRGIDDWNGHGTHITSIMMSSDRSEAGRYQGVAPNANVVAVRAFEPDGSGSYLNVIKALDWIVSNQKKYKIRILNLSFGATAASHYWDDPVNQAIMAAWKKGIIVVVAAGNGGPGPMTVGVPANVPYVITVGAMTDNYTPDDTSDDRLATFSAAGPTFEGFVKPELVAPGGHMLGQMPPYAWLPLEHPEYVHQVNDNFTMSGTSQAAAVVSGVMALMLQLDPKLSPDAAKCRVMASARTARRDDGTHAYSVFQQGAGLVDAVAATSNYAVDCANRNMNIKDDLKGKKHYAGPSGVDENGTYYLVDEHGTRLSGRGFEWIQGSLWRSGAVWAEGSVWPEGVLWNQGVLWNRRSSLNSDSLLNQGSVWPEGSVWPQGLTRSVSTTVWVDAE